MNSWINLFVKQSVYFMHTILFESMRGGKGNCQPKVNQDRVDHTLYTTVFWLQKWLKMCKPSLSVRIPMGTIQLLYVFKIWWSVPCFTWTSGCHMLCVLGINLGFNYIWNHTFFGSVLKVQFIDEVITHYYDIIAFLSERWWIPHCYYRN